MNRKVSFAIIGLFAIVGTALVGADNEALARRGCNGCGGGGLFARMKARCGNDCGRANCGRNRGCEAPSCSDDCGCGRQGLFARMRARRAAKRCCQPACGAPAPSCCQPAPACEPAPCCAPEPSCDTGCGGCDSGCGGCDSGCCGDAGAPVEAPAPAAPEAPEADAST